MIETIQVVNMEIIVNTIGSSTTRHVVYYLDDGSYLRGTLTDACKMDGKSFDAWLERLG